jgi:hypothetical protein
MTGMRILPALAAGLFALTQLGLSQGSLAQNPPATSPWINSVAYELARQGDKRVFLVHVLPTKLDSLPVGTYPCGNSPIEMDSLILDPKSILVSGTEVPHIASQDLAATQVGDEYQFRLLVGDGQPLPTAWKSVAFSIPGHCKDNPQMRYLSPLIKVSKNLYADDNKVQLKYGVPTWYRLAAGGKVNDMIALTLLSARPISITTIAMRESSTNNKISEVFPDLFESTSHDVRFSTFREPLDTGSTYFLDISATEDGVPLTAKVDMPLPTL